MQHRYCISVFFKINYPFLLLFYWYVIMRSKHLIMSIFRTKFFDLGTTFSPALLPTITLLVLLFFMVTMVLRKTGDSLEDNIMEQPGVMEQKSSVTEIIIRLPRDTVGYGSDPIIESGGRQISSEEFLSFIESEKNKLPENEQEGFTISLRIDPDIPMGKITELTDELRMAEVRRVQYEKTKNVKL